MVTIYMKYYLERDDLRNLSILSYLRLVV